MEHCDDALSDDRLLYDIEQPLPLAPHEENPYRRFVYDDYDWTGFSVEGQVAIKLTQGFFTFVGEEDAERLKGRSPFAHVHRCPRTKEILNVRAAIKYDGEWMFLHRFLMNAGKGSIIDHVNNWPLDNRSKKNLWDTNSNANNANRFRPRTVNKGLLRGVEPRGDKFGGKIKFEGVTYHSKEMWDKQEPAHEWHVSEYKRLHGIVELGIKPERSYPLFPRRRQSALVVPDFVPMPTPVVVDDILATF